MHPMRDETYKTHQTTHAHRVVTHHRRNGDMLTHAQEETILIVAFGLLWLGASAS